MEKVVQPAFFRRTEVLSAIDDIRKSESVTVYAGAGVSLDRSGLSWTLLIQAILEPHVPDATARASFVTSNSPLFAASAAHQFYLEASPESISLRQQDAHQRISDIIRPLLYSPGIWRGGELANAIADFVYVWNQADPLIGNVPPRGCIVTTNYDDYLVAALEAAYKAAKTDAKNRDLSSPTVRFPTDTDPLVNADASIADWVRQDPATRGDSVDCIHLHGFLPRSVNGEFRFPVVSENDYFQTAQSSQQVLTSLLTQSDLLIVGASLTDPPLLRALEETRALEKRRWALISLRPDFGGSGALYAEQRRMIRSRLSALGVTPIFVDYYVQQTQFFRELISARKIRSSKSKYGAPRNPYSYYTRLGAWWRALRLGTNAALGMQNVVHQFLRQNMLPECKEILDCPDEAIKIELWIRWDPTNERSFRLFGSSVGIWVDVAAMRVEAIDSFEESIIMDSFREGRPILRTGGASYGGRWPAVLAVPIWSEAHGTEFVTGVMVLASQKEPPNTALDEQRNRAALADCTRYMQRAGNFLTDPDSWEHSRPQ